MSMFFSILQIYNTFQKTFLEVGTHMKYITTRSSGTPPLPSSTQIYRIFMLNPTIIVICLFILIFSLFAYIAYFNAHVETKYYKVNMN